MKRMTKSQVTVASGKTALLDAAESLFAERGYYGASMREITTLAAVPHGLVTYHFQSKEDLFRQVVDRRADDIVTMLHRQLDLMLRTAPAAARVFEIISAYVAGHLLYAAQGPAEARYLRLTQQLVALGRRRALIDELIQKVAPVTQRYLAALSAALHDIAKPEIEAGFHLMRLSLAGLLVDVHLPTPLASSNVDVTISRFACYCAAGIEAFVRYPAHPSRATAGSGSKR